VSTGSPTTSQSRYIKALSALGPILDEDVLYRGISLLFTAEIEFDEWSSQLFARGALPPDEALLHPDEDARSVQRLSGTVTPEQRWEGPRRGRQQCDVTVAIRADNALLYRCSCREFVKHARCCQHVAAFVFHAVQSDSLELPVRVTALRAAHAAVDQPDGPRRPSAVPEVRPPAVSCGDAWRATLAPARDGAPAPLVYVLNRIDRYSLHRRLDCCRREVDADGVTQLVKVNFDRLNMSELDKVDCALVRALLKMNEGEYRSSRPGEKGTKIVTRAARAGRLHRRGAEGPGPALQWRGDEEWSAEMHVAPVDPRVDPSVNFAARRWLRLVTGEVDEHGQRASRDQIDCMEPCAGRFGSLYIAGDSLVDVAPPEELRRPVVSYLGYDDWFVRPVFGEAAMAQLAAGAQTYPPENLPELQLALRHEPGNYGSNPRVTLHLDPAFGISVFAADPVPVLRLSGGGQRVTIDVQPLVRYRHPTDDSIVVDRDPRDHGFVDDPTAPAMTVPRADLAYEREFHYQAQELLRGARGSGERKWRIPRTQMQKLLKSSAKARVAVEMERQPARAGGKWSLSVSSGIDWFNLDGQLETPEGAIALRDLVTAARKAPGAIEILPLLDGTSVLVPAKMRAVLRRLAQIMARRDDEALRFSTSEALLVDALLEGADRTKDDAAFRELRKRLHAFSAPAPQLPPDCFVGALRDYQQLGLGWFDALRQLRMGGCLADEMGLGKTVQVLAMLAAQHEVPLRRTKSKVPAVPVRPSLLVVPRSIVRNWMDEAARFVPALRVLDLSQSDRELSDATWNTCDVAIMTYGTVLRDVTDLAQREFHYVILDEAQAIKNVASRTAKAVKCLRGQHRLLMTGTPIENHLGELWSLMEFLNPALGHHLEKLAGEGDSDDLAVVRRAVRPFILRRLKRDVAKELPDRIEQTMHCDMTAGQRTHYNALLDRVRADLLGAMDDTEFVRSKLQVLESLLRLRQIACHPVLVDKKRSDAGSGKLEALLPMLEESAMEGRKTLVFSQFTSFLAIVRQQLDERGIVYEYLDGSTRDRAARVRRFNEDAACPVFLLSLKAGGVGLNLHAAERVILLDPWWNPAVEAQAIDRAHRIGQTRTVHAIRLVSAGTIEDRVLELQQQKRALADAIVSADAGPLASMTRDDLAFLLDAKRT